MSAHGKDCLCIGEDYSFGTSLLISSRIGAGRRHIPFFCDVAFLCDNMEWSAIMELDF